MDPQGLGMEDFDAAGRYRTMENGLPVDNSGELKNAQDATFSFHGGAERYENEMIERMHVEAAQRLLDRSAH